MPETLAYFPLALPGLDEGLAGGLGRVPLGRGVEGRCERGAGGSFQVARQSQRHGRAGVGDRRAGRAELEPEREAVGRILGVVGRLVVAGLHVGGPGVHDDDRLALGSVGDVLVEVVRYPGNGVLNLVPVEGIVSLLNDVRLHGLCERLRLSRALLDDVLDDGAVGMVGYLVLVRVVRHRLLFLVVTTRNVDDIGALGRLAAGGRGSVGVGSVLLGVDVGVVAVVDVEGVDPVGTGREPGLIGR